MRLLACFLLPLALSLAGCGDNKDASTKTTNSSAPGANPLNAPADYLGGLANGRNVAVKVVDTAALNQAVQLFNAQEGRNPKDLNELVTSHTIGSIPDAPPGKKLDYDPATGTVRVVDK